jgi:hypothetical protein
MHSIWCTNGTARKACPYRPSLRPYRRSFRFRKLWSPHTAWRDVRFSVVVLYRQLASTDHPQPR